MHMLDTNICIAILRGRPASMAEKFRDAMEGGVSVSSVTVAELYYGIARSTQPAKELAGVERLLGALSTLSFGTEAARTYGAIRRHLEARGQSIGQFDLLIASHAIAEKAILVTSNGREFSRVPTLTIADWHS